MNKKAFHMRSLAAAVFLVILALALPARAAGMFGAETFRLQNGMEVVVIPNHRAPVVSHMVWYKYGGADEPPGHSGIAHFLEHLMFKGTLDVPEGQFSQAVTRMGGNENAFTTHDYTAFYQNVARKNLEKVMMMEADRMKNLALSPETVASEREVVVEERLQRIDNQPQARLREQVMAALYMNHPYAVPVIGWMHEIKGLTRDAVFDEYDKWYAPNNAVLVVAGDVTAAQVRPLAEKYYGAIPAQPLPDRTRPRMAPLAAQHRIILQDARVGQPMLQLVYRAPRGDDALDVMSEVFGGTSTARLYNSLVIEKKLATSAGSDYDPMTLDGSMFTIYASPAPGVTLNQLEAAMNQELAKIAQGGVTEAELAAGKNRKRAGYAYYLDSLQGPALLFGRALATGFDAAYVESYDSRIAAVTAEDVKAAARMIYGQRDGSVVGLLLPAQKKAEAAP